MKELPIPNAATSDRTAREVARVWAAGTQQHVSLEIDALPDPAAWGLLMVDLARKLAAAYSEQRGLDPQQVLDRIRDAFDAEWNYPTDLPTSAD